MLFNKSDVRPIARAHLQTLSDNRFGTKPSTREIFAYFGIPALVGLALAATGFRFRVDAVNGFLNVFSVLTGLLLNVLVLVITMGLTKPSEKLDFDRRSRLMKETFANISFSVLIAVSVVCTALVSLSYMRSIQYATTGPIATFLLCALTISFLLILLMVMKRMFILVTKELGVSGSNGSKAA